MPFETLAAAAAVLLLTYTVFGLTGFGSTALAVPLLVHLLPLRYVVPMLLILDLVASLLVSGRGRRGLRYDEIWRVAPFMIAGLLLGVTLLIGVPEQPLIIVLGLFLVVYAAYGLSGRGGPIALAAWWCAPFGLVSGAFASMFGNGGAILALYFSGRLRAKEELRATSAAMVLLNGGVRVGLFALAGLFAQDGLLGAAAILLVPALAGLYLGNRLHQKVSAERVLQAVYAVVALAGVSLLVRAAMV